MKSSRAVTLAVCAFVALSSITADAGPLVSPRSTGHTNATAVWIIFGCASSIIFTAYVKHLRQHRELTPVEAHTCGIAYWFTIQNPR